MLVDSLEQVLDQLAWDPLSAPHSRVTRACAM